jgi:hypothetical protein
MGMAIERIPADMILLGYLGSVTPSNPLPLDFFLLRVIADGAGCGMFFY